MPTASPPLFYLWPRRQSRADSKPRRLLLRTHARATTLSTRTRACTFLCFQVQRRRASVVVDTLQFRSAIPAAVLLTPRKYGHAAEVRLGDDEDCYLVARQGPALTAERTFARRNWFFLAYLVPVDTHTHTRACAPFCPHFTLSSACSARSAHAAFFLAHAPCTVSNF